MLLHVCPVTSFLHQEYKLLCFSSDNINRYWVTRQGLNGLRDPKGRVAFRPCRVTQYRLILSLGKHNSGYIAYFDQKMAFCVELSSFIADEISTLVRINFRAYHTHTHTEGESPLHSNNTQSRKKLTLHPFWQWIWFERFLSCYSQFTNTACHIFKRQKVCEMLHCQWRVLKRNKVMT